MWKEHSVLDSKLKNDGLCSRVGTGIYGFILSYLTNVFLIFSNIILSTRLFAEFPNKVRTESPTMYWKFK
ncbi:hypothetical protein ARMGADRAFT_491786 [Armillaria gallica]|uniref:Uncharacterized protein n=1 Tax=Armillaria gallica TaxID=47427 RepID=A0A2H3ECZ5_ARMGA|nr:hypothetical protein ARMGADRAFT_491786 [Armillaria gallica]